MPLQFFKGHGAPGTYTSRDGRTFKAGSLAPTDLPKKDVEDWTAIEYLVPFEAPKVVQVGHDTPDAKPAAKPARVAVDA
ncbi:MAG: hypothetical protein ABR562_03670 [Thermoplasmatota archaeon]